jgi:ferritin-like protein
MMINLPHEIHKLHEVIQIHEAYLSHSPPDVKRNIYRAGDRELVESVLEQRGYK